MALMKDKHWEMHNKAVNEFHYDAFQQEVIWKKNVVRTNIHGEDYGQKYDEIKILGLIQYNQFRAWPITRMTDSGEIDKQNFLLYLNNKYLSEAGLLNEFGQFQYDAGKDFFEINGVLYKSMGDSQASQVQNSNPQLFFIILKREDLLTGDNTY